MYICNHVSGVCGDCIRCIAHGTWPWPGHECNLRYYCKRTKAIVYCVEVSYKIELPKELFEI